MKKTSIPLSLIFVLITTVYCQADWVDDWINQSVVSGPNNFETQKRNYATFGNVSARWSTHADPLVSISKPRFKAGCGGIDAYLGGFSYMEFDYLVQKLQRIMGSSAAAFAFDIALNVLCEPCANAIKAFEAITDRLNQLQIDDCKAAKVVGATIVDAASGFSSDKVASERTQAWTDFVQSTGVEDLWQEVKDSAGDKTPKDAAAAAGVGPDQLVSSCPALIKQAFFTDGSLLGNLSQMRNYPGAYVDLMRGLIGDVIITSKIEHSFLPACDNNNKIADVSTKIYLGEIEAMDNTGACTPLKKKGVTINGKHHNSYRDWVISVLSSITTKMMTGVSFTNEETSMLENTPENAYTAIKGYLLNMGQNADPTDAALQFEKLVGHHYIYSMFADYYKYLDDIISYAHFISSQQMGSATGDDQKHCQIKLLGSTLKTLEDMKGSAAKMMEMAYLSYTNEIGIIQDRQTLGKEFVNTAKEGAARIRSMVSSTSK